MQESLTRFASSLGGFRSFRRGRSLPILATAAVALSTLGAASTTRPAGPTTRAANHAALSLDEIFAKLDTNHDGKITQAEATGVFAKRFAKWDAAHRGFVTRQDIHDFRAALGIDDDGNRTEPVDRPPAITGKVLTEPDDWNLENFPVPPPFAPEVKLAGSEEARFAPGMYDPTSDTYFTYAIAITATGDPAWGPPELKDFLETYFRGLSSSRAHRRGTDVDVSQIVATVTPPSPTAAADRLEAQVAFIDSFTDGRRTTLHVESRALRHPGNPQTVLILLISPSATDSPTWKALRDVGDHAAANVH